MSSSKNSTTTMIGVPAYAEPFVRSYLEKGNAIAFGAAYDSFFTVYPDETWAPLFQNELDGIEALATRGRNGSPLITKGTKVITDIIDGSHLEGNKPQFQDMLGKSTTKPSNIFETPIRSRVGGSLYGIGDFSANNQAFVLTAPISKRYNDRAAASLYKDSYDIERVNQSRILPKAIDYSKESIKNAEWLRRSGVHYRAWLQGSHEENYKKWYEGQVLEVNRVELLGNTIRALVGTSSKKTVPFRVISKAVTVGMGMASGALTGVYIGSYWPGAGTIIVAVVGAIVGGVVAYFSS